MRRNTLLLTCLAVLCLCGIAMACPNCSDTVASADSAGTPGISSAFNSSIYLMLGAFIGVLGMVGFVMVRAIREEAGKNQNDEIRMTNQIRMPE